jgi:hypothetical protein
MKHKLLFTSLLLLSITQVLEAQIGIKTSNPQAALDIGGTVRVTELPLEQVETISLTGLTSGNVLNRTEVGANIVVVDNNEITTAPVSREMGNFNLGLEPIDRYVAGLPQIDNLDLKINPGGDNETATYITVQNYPGKYIIAGIANGTEGRKVTLFLSETKNIKFLEDDSFALAKCWYFQQR